MEAVAGRGALLEALERLKTKLASEGLFDPSAKRAIPTEPRVIGVVTSKTGAVIHDICKVAFRRGGARVLLAPALVQGAGAAGSIRRALADLSRVKDVDVIIIDGVASRSSDDLSAFNDEEVSLVRAVAEVSRPGHQRGRTRGRRDAHGLRRRRASGHAVASGRDGRPRHACAEERPRPLSHAPRPRSPRAHPRRWAPPGRGREAPR